ncbi:hypothetical protein BGP78_08005 [Pseudoalteromonas sp. MSK9-3]|uniref:hypothetical protein n=1 Tax=Pseudoalteromonas sp. MSK9-3 TaxID=1897633 RepID=UPI000E6BE191|nr:hypothetical protein [Pseudoalteromonas sp. MSK9-3]RJE77714.1 hypothetical protein BGP78_08005 [Pseudoalteromonas sp. MSK9-3]
MKIKLNKKNIKKLSNDVTSLPNNQTPQVVGGNLATRGACETLGCDTAVYLGCYTGRACYSAVNEICPMP